jgi:hypothetical protein
MEWLNRKLVDKRSMSVLRNTNNQSKNNN